jgi:hypothetical protein
MRLLITCLMAYLHAVDVLAPGLRIDPRLAMATASVVAFEPPLFAGDEDRRRTVALVAAIQFRESSFRMSARSATDDFCAMGLNRRADLADDAEGCVRVGLEMLRESARVDPGNPVAFYASGMAYQGERARRISRDRMALAQLAVARYDDPRLLFLDP